MREVSRSLLGGGVLLGLHLAGGRGIQNYVDMDSGDIQDYPGCGDYFSKFTLCLSPKHQMYHYYATGDTEHCPLYAKDFMTCLKAQTEHSDASRNALLDNTTLMARQRVRNSVFEFKEVPSWSQQ